MKCKHAGLTVLSNADALTKELKKKKKNERDASLWTHWSLYEHLQLFTLGAWQFTAGLPTKNLLTRNVRHVFFHLNFFFGCIWDLSANSASKDVSLLCLVGWTWITSVHSLLFFHECQLTAWCVDLYALISDAWLKKTNKQSRLVLQNTHGRTHTDRLPLLFLNS